jgi:23S rRNA (guanosine2251-2'-O)-methyltransferase
MQNASQDMKKDSQRYLDKKMFFNKMLTIYGRNAVLEALYNESIEVYKLHLSQTNAPAKILDEMITIAKKRNIEVVYHDKVALSRISKNSKQDQGVALDIYLESFMESEEFLKKHSTFRLLVLDGITNPQNVGMIVRSAVAGNIDGIVLPSRGGASLSPLVIKASAGTLFKLPMIKSSKLLETLKQFKKSGATLYTLRADATSHYNEVAYPDKTLFILGNETTGVSSEVESVCDESIAIPMKRDVESLNVAVTAALLAFM